MDFFDRIFSKATRSIKDEFADFLADLIFPHAKRKSFFGALLLGRQRRSREMPFLPPDVYRDGELVVDNSGLRASIVRKFESDPNSFGASLVMTLDPVVFAKLTGRLKPYINIPTTTGANVLGFIAYYMVSKEGPIARMFNEEAGPDGPWPELSSSELRWREKHGYAEGPILDASGALRKAVISPDTVEEVKGGKYARAVLGPSKLPENNHIVDKFYVHMLGYNDGFGKGIPIPPRPFMPRNENDLTPDEEKHIAKLVREGIQLGKLDERVRITRDFRGRFAKIGSV